MMVETIELKRLGEVKAPAGFADRVLAGAGIGDSYAPFDTARGRVFVAWNRNGISAAARFSTAAEFEWWFRKEIGRRLVAADAPAELASKISAEVTGNRHLRYDLRGLTDFEQSVLRKALQIPRGQVRPYSWVAREIGHPAAVRAVGTALANNPIPYLIPCHRVIRADGVIGNYGGGGPEAKKQILGMEGVQLTKLEQLGRSGYRFEGCKTTGVYCYPTCHHARRALERNVIRLHDAVEARAAGFRPCKVCRPAA